VGRRKRGGGRLSGSDAERSQRGGPCARQGLWRGAVWKRESGERGSVEGGGSGVQVGGVGQLRVSREARELHGAGP